ncbi:retrovirus-related pol polyprotein from transposon TNT 1-94, partial [Tanacetum coccineum]
VRTNWSSPRMQGDVEMDKIRGRVEGRNGRRKTQQVLPLVNYSSSTSLTYGLWAYNASAAQVWHKHLGHISEAGLHEQERRDVWDNKGLGTLQQNGLADLVWFAKFVLERSNGHPTNYEILRIFGCVAYSHVNQGKLNPRAIKYVFLGYPDGVKGYRLWRFDDVKPKIIISKDVVFNKSLMYKDTLKGAGAADYGREVVFEVELQDSRVEPTVDLHTGENTGNKDEEQDEEPQQ